jgi:hypothetical protein
MKGLENEKGPWADGPLYHRAGAQHPILPKCAVLNVAPAQVRVFQMKKGRTHRPAFERR